MPTATADLRETAAELEAVVGELERRGLIDGPPFSEFVARHNPTLPDFEHVPKLLDVADRVVRGELDRVLVLLPPRYFKALDDDTMIATPDGWSRIADLETGDEVFGPDGETTRVTAVRHWRGRPCYRATTDDGHSIVCDAQHDWAVRLCRNRPDTYTVHNTEDLYRRQGQMKDFRRPALPRHAALSLPDAELPIAPYTLGVWLGDGTSQHATITSGDDDREWMRGQIESDGYKTSDRATESTFGVRGLQRPLRKAELLGSKRVPRAYFRASIEQRKALLQGLVDTDGTVNADAYGQVTFVTTRRGLADDVCRLVHTLGVKASIGEYRAELDGRDCGPKWYVTFHYSEAARLPRKREHCQDGTRTPHRFVDFEPAEPRDTTCISVDREDGLFLAGEALIVTHNSETFSRLLPAHFLRAHPGKHVGLTSYGAELAWELSEEARDYYVGDGGELDAEAKKRWTNPEGGEMWAAGVGGAMLGRGYHLGIVDDPIKPEDAHSPTYQKRFERWWPSKFLSRAEPGAAIVVVMQRLGTDDPVDYLLRREVGEDTDEAPQHWHVVVMDEVKSDEPLGRWDGPMGLPDTCTVEPDDRAVGDVLAPTRFNPDQVDEKQSSAGTLVTSAQRQQRPMTPTGDFWQEGWFRTYTDLPEDAYRGGKDWDTAYTSDEANSASAYVESYRGPGDPEQFPIYIENIDWDWREFPELVAWMKSLTGPHHIEQKASGKSAAQSLQRQGVAVHEVPVEGGDKFARAAGVQPVVSNRRVYVHERVRDQLLEGDRQGLLRITAEQLQNDGPNLDLNDAFVQALHRHTGGGRPGTVRVVHR